MSRTFEGSVEIRSRIIADRIHGFTYRILAEKYLLSPLRIRKFILRFEEPGSIQNLPESGQKLKTTCRDDRRIFRETQRSLISIQQIKKLTNIDIRKFKIIWFGKFF